MPEYQSVSDIENIVRTLKFDFKDNKNFNRVKLKAKLIAKLKDLVKLMNLMSFNENNEKSYDAKLFNCAFQKAFERYGEKGKNGKIISLWLLFQDEQINKIADDLKFGYFGCIEELKFLENRLINFLLIRKNFKMFSSLYISEKGTMKDFKNNSRYSGEIFAKTYKDCLRKYGEEYEIDGKIKPFMKLFNECYNTKNQELKAEKFEDECGLEKEMKKANLDGILKDFQKKIGSKIKKKNYKYDNYKRFFEKNNANEKELKSLEKAFSDKYITEESNYIETNKKNNKMKYSLADKLSIRKIEEKNNILKELIFLLDKADIKLRKNKGLYKYFRCYVSIKIIEEEGYDMALNSYIYVNFIRYYYNNKSKYLNEKLKLNEDELIGSYLNKKPETIRKIYRKKLESILLKLI